MKILADLSLTGWRRAIADSFDPDPIPDPNSEPDPDPDPEPGEASLPDIGYDLALLTYDPDTLYSDTAGTTLAVVDGRVARASDTSGNGSHATQGTVAARPHYRVGAGIPHLNFDGMDDRLVIAPDASWRKTGQSIVMVARAVPWTNPTVNFGVLLGSANNTRHIFAMRSGDTAGGSEDRTTASSRFFKNGTNIGIRSGLSRGDLYDAYVTSEWLVLEVADARPTSSDFSGGLQFPGRDGIGLQVDADIGFLALIPTATLDTGTNRADLVAALAAKFGITL